MNFLVLICLWSCSSWLSPALPLSPPFLHISFAFHAPSLFLVHLIFKQNDEPAGQEKKNAERGQMREKLQLTSTGQANNEWVGWLVGRLVALWVQGT